MDEGDPICRNCDLGFSCDSYLTYDRNWRKFAAFYAASADEGEDQDRLDLSVNAVTAAVEAAEIL